MSSSDQIKEHIHFPGKQIMTHNAVYSASPGYSKLNTPTLVKTHEFLHLNMTDFHRTGPHICSVSIHTLNKNVHVQKKVSLANTNRELVF